MLIEVEIQRLLCAVACVLLLLEVELAIAHRSSQEKQALQVVALDKHHAFLSLLYGDDDRVVKGLQTLFQSLRAAGAASDFIVLVPAGDVAIKFRPMFQHDGVRMVMAPPIDIPKSMGETKQR